MRWEAALKPDRGTANCGAPNAARCQLCSTPAVERCIKGFPERLKKAIGTQSVRAFAAATGLSEGTLRKYLRNETYPTLDRLIRIVNAGQVCLPWLVTGQGPIRPPEADPTAQGNEIPDESSRRLLEALEVALQQAGQGSTGLSVNHNYRIDRIWDSGDNRCYVLVVKAEN